MVILGKLTLTTALNGLTLQGRGLKKGRRQEALCVLKGGLQQQGGVQDCQPATRGRFPSSLWTDFQFANIQLARELNASGTSVNYNPYPENFVFTKVIRWFEIIYRPLRYPMSLQKVSENR